MKPGKTYKYRICNVGLKNSLNFRIQGHLMKLVEMEGSHTVQNTYESLDILVGQCFSVLVTADQEPRDYYMIASTRFTKQVITATRILRYTNGKGPASPVLPPAPEGWAWSLNQFRSFPWNLTASAARRRPGSRRKQRGQPRPDLAKQHHRDSSWIAKALKPSRIEAAVPFLFLGTVHRLLPRSLLLFVCSSSAVPFLGHLDRGFEPKAPDQEGSSSVEAPGGSSSAGVEFRRGSSFVVSSSRPQIRRAQVSSRHLVARAPPTSSSVAARARPGEARAALAKSGRRWRGKLSSRPPWTCPNEASEGRPPLVRARPPPSLEA